MKGATQCAKRLQAYFKSLRSELGKATPPAVSDPITQMLLGIMTRNTPESKARTALEAIQSMVVDYNELRVIPSSELAELMGDVLDARVKSEDMVRALNCIFAREHAVTLEQLKSMNKKDVAAYLDEVEGLEAYTRARIRLLGLELHAIPLDEAMWALAREEGIVDATCPLDEAQAFLERQIAADDALEFVALLHKQAWVKMGARVRKGDVEHVTSVPPERRTSHMLQDLAPNSTDDVDMFDAEDDGFGGSEFGEAGAEEGAEEKSGKKKGKKAGRKKAAPKPAAKPAPKRAAKKAVAKAVKKAVKKPVAKAAKTAKKKVRRTKSA